VRFKFARRPTTGRAHVCAEQEDRGESADPHPPGRAAASASNLDMRPPGIGIAANFDRTLKTGRTSTKCLESEGSRRQAPDRPQSSCWRRGASRPYGLALQARWRSRKRRLPLKQGGSRQIERTLQFLRGHFWVVVRCCHRLATPYPQERRRDTVGTKWGAPWLNPRRPQCFVIS
jgi:hypothetical protein